MTYEDLSKLGGAFLAQCGRLTLDEHDRFEEEPVTSANEVLGLATRILAEQAKVLQDMADKEERT